MEIREPSNSLDYKHYDTERLRKEYLIEEPFGIDKIKFVYSHFDRIIAGGVVPLTKEVILSTAAELKMPTFLARREMGAINIGGEGIITVDGTEYPLCKYDCLYLGMGCKVISFKSTDSKNPAKFYLNSSPAHHSYPTKIIKKEDAVHRHCGSKSECNERTINQYILPGKCESCQLVMGLTHLEEGSIWNTMPCHTHERRMEVYLYFDMLPEDVVIHLMGPKEETRHIIVKNEQAVISPSWSIHSGAGTRNYTFIWGMCGENQEFDDMDGIKPNELK